LCEYQGAALQMKTDGVVAPIMTNLCAPPYYT